MDEVEYSSRVVLDGIDYEEAVGRVTEALEEEGFGILTEIDVKQTLREKLGEDFKRYVILGACNPPLAHQVLSADDNIGLLLPCNVVVAETDAGSEAAYIRPEAMLSFADRPGLDDLAREAERRLSRAFEQL